MHRDIPLDIEWGTAILRRSLQSVLALQQMEVGGKLHKWAKHRPRGECLPSTHVSSD
jgi:hypothetical protein